MGTNNYLWGDSSDLYRWEILKDPEYRITFSDDYSGGYTILTGTEGYEILDKIIKNKFVNNIKLKVKIL